MNKHSLISLFVCWIVLFHVAYGQNTVGLITNSSELSYPGLNLIYPHNQSNIYLLNNCGEIVHQWEDDADFRPGNTAYLLDNGSLLKTKRPSETPTNVITAGGAGGLVEIRDWNNNLEYSYTIMDSMKRAHHDIAPLPNGNFLMVVWEVKVASEVIENGRDTSLYQSADLWPDYIVEIDPVLDSIVWEWHAWDHLIQDYDSTKQNFGVISDHPERIDINVDLDGLGVRGDWMHVNSIDYNPILNQILISVPYFDEIWIIDHSTTTEEAKGTTGGVSNRGGDLLFRWGNPAIYNTGTEQDQLLFFQHDANWDDNFIPGQEANNQVISVFNNRVLPNASNIVNIAPLWNNSTKQYEMRDGRFLPANYRREVFHPDTISLYSTGLSSVQLLPNENYLITGGRSGYSFELDSVNQIVWEYITPLRNGDPVTQGETLELNDNNTFRMDRYPLDFMAFEGRDLSPTGYIELEPNIGFCGEMTTTTFEPRVSFSSILSPNPTNGIITISIPEYQGTFDLFIYNFNGRLVIKQEDNQRVGFIELNTAGVYFVIGRDDEGRLLFQDKVMVH